MATRKWNTEILVNTTLTGTQDQSSITGLADGGFVATWRDDSPSDSAIRWQRFDATGVKVGVERTVMNSVSGDQSLPDVVQLSDGNLWFAMRDFDSPGDDDIEGFVYTPTGTFVRAQAANATGINHGDPAIASLGANGAVAVFRSPAESGGDIKMSIFDAAGVKTLDTANVNDNSSGTVALNQEDPAVAANTSGTRFVVVWDDDAENIRARVFNQSGVSLSPEITLNAVPANGVFIPQVTWLDETRWVVAWTLLDAPTGDGSNSSIKYQIYGEAGLIGDERIANGTVYNQQTEPMITSLPDGGFVIAWTDASLSRGDSSLAAIRLQLFDSAGDKRGGEIVVNTTTTGNQYDSAIATLADGRVVVSWTDASAGSTDIRSQIIDPRDGVIDGTAGADTLYGHDSVGDVISADDGADTVYGLAGADTIYGSNDDDNLYGGRGDDTSYGGANNDRIYGDLGDDEQYGDSGNDLIYSGRGADLMDGGAGSDTAYYSTEIVGAVINLLNQSLNAGSADGDTLAGIETIFGSLTAADNISGDNLNNTLLGNGGADTLNGNGGGDVLRGGAGADILNGGTGADKFQYTALADLGDTISAFEAADDFQFLRTAFGNLAGASVAAVNFLSVASGNAATTINHRFIFDQATDRLWYDADGSTATIAAVMVADLSNNINITAADLLLF